MAVVQRIPGLVGWLYRRNWFVGMLAYGVKWLFTFFVGPILLLAGVPVGLGLLGYPGAALAWIVASLAVVVVGTLLAVGAAGGRL